jgi:hypothetical protein
LFVPADGEQVVDIPSTWRDIAARQGYLLVVPMGAFKDRFERVRA